MNIPASDLPGQNELYTDYLYHFENLRKYFEYDYRRLEEIFKCIEYKKETYLNGKNFFRTEVTEILNDQNSGFCSGDKAFSNIRLLNDNNTFAIVTGQQTGLLTGPFYTILKALNAIRLSEFLNDKFREFKFVPLFWMEADDHDFKEINNINLLTQDNKIQNIEYLINGEEQDKYLKPASGIIFDNFINEFTNKIDESLQNSDFKNELMNNIRNFYKPGNNVVLAFAGFINSLIGDRGLILVNPSDARLKKFLKPVFKRELGTAPHSCEAVIDTSDELEAVYTAQIKPKVVNLFYIHEDNRYLIETRENEVYALKHSRQKFSKDELFALLEDHTERFSWNVVTRPVCQDYLFPTVAYIGGPSEIAYFAQLKNVYKIFEESMPVIYPRISVTILENKVKNFMDKFNLTFAELFNEKELARKLIAASSGPDLDSLFADMKEKLTGLFYSYEKELGSIDENQTASFTKRNKQFLDSLDVAKEKYLNLQTKKNEVISGKLNMVSANIYPGNNFQERVVNIIYFLNKYGLNIINRLYEEIKIDDFTHQVITPEPEQINSD